MEEANADAYRTLLSIDYSKLLSYLAALLVFFFTLFQISTEVSRLPWYVVILLSSLSCGGVVVFIGASYSNYKEILELENELGLSEITKPSGIFSNQRKGSKEREVSIALKLTLWILGLSSFVVFLVNLRLAALF